MKQTRTMSMIETIVSTAIKFLWAMTLWQLIVGPMFGYVITLHDNFLLTGIFTINSMVVGYVVRRYFNNRG